MPASAKHLAATAPVGPAPIIKISGSVFIWLLGMGDPKLVLSHLFCQVRGYVVVLEVFLQPFIELAASLVVRDSVISRGGMIAEVGCTAKDGVRRVFHSWRLTHLGGRSGYGLAGGQGRADQGGFPATQRIARRTSVL